MIKQSKAMRLWNILYPICIYYVVTTITLYILNFILPKTQDLKLFRQLLTSIAVLPFLYSFYRQDQMLRGRESFWKFPKQTTGSFGRIAGMFLIGGCFALAFNNVLGLIRITEYSASYSEVAETFYTGRMALEVVSLCIVIPIVEELLYRGIVYQRTKDWLGVRAAAVLSALIFGAVHMNLAQFVYAAVFGLLLAYFTETTGNLFGAAAAHIAANFTSVLRAETGVFDFLDRSMAAYITGTVMFAVFAAAGLFWLYQKNPGQRKGES